MLFLDYYIVLGFVDVNCCEAFGGVVWAAVLGCFAVEGIRSLFGFGEWSRGVEFAESYLVSFVCVVVCFGDVVSDCARYRRDVQERSCLTKFVFGYDVGYV